MRLRSLSLLLAALATLLPAARADNCGIASNRTVTACSQCVLRADCGWCDGSRRCIEGNAAGPLNATQCAPTPSSQNYYWQCPASNDCAIRNTCELCTRSGSCGWCASTNQCVAGTASHPAASSCPLTNIDGGGNVTFAYNYQSCNAASCPASRDCGSCLGNTGAQCRWCISATTTEPLGCGHVNDSTPCPRMFTDPTKTILRVEGRDMLLKCYEVTQIPVQLFRDSFGLATDSATRPASVTRSQAAFIALTSVVWIVWFACIWLERFRPSREASSMPTHYGKINRLWFVPLGLGLFVTQCVMWSWHWSSSPDYYSPAADAAVDSANPQRGFFLLWTMLEASVSESHWSRGWDHAAGQDVSFESMCRSHPSDTCRTMLAASKITLTASVLGCACWIALGLSGFSLNAKTNADSMPGGNFFRFVFDLSAMASALCWTAVIAWGLGVHSVVAAVDPNSRLEVAWKIQLSVAVVSLALALASRAFLWNHDPSRVHARLFIEYEKHPKQCSQCEVKLPWAPNFVLPPLCAPCKKLDDEAKLAAATLAAANKPADASPVAASPSDNTTISIAPASPSQAVGDAALVAVEGRADSSPLLMGALTPDPLHAENSGVELASYGISSSAPPPFDPSLAVALVPGACLPHPFDAIVTLVTLTAPAVFQVRAAGVTWPVRGSYSVSALQARDAGVMQVAVTELREDGVQTEVQRADLRQLTLSAADDGGFDCPPPPSDPVPDAVLARMLIGSEFSFDLLQLGIAGLGDRATRIRIAVEWCGAKSNEVEVTVQA